MVGAEVELLPVSPGPERRPIPLRGPVDGPPSVLGFLKSWAQRTGALFVEREAGVLSFQTQRGGRITFEPGGQPEFSTAPRETAAGALADLRAVLGSIHREGRDAGG